MSNDLLMQHAVAALEKIAEAQRDLFQARKIGMEVVIPADVETAYVGKHGDDGRKVIDFLRGNVNLTVHGKEPIMQKSNEDHEVTSPQIDGLGTLQGLLMYVFLGMTCTGIALWALPYSASAFEISVLFPTAIAIFSLWQSFRFYNDLCSLLRKP
ncbi:MULTISPECIES: hypothetical protein [Pseudomonas]|uniref:hypothetical protein n=1 Tax=Pseudomonas TaxID=286 RepID=UPI00070FEBAA|nr:MULTISPECIES: hypothetical protein [Pseudomonas]KQW19906.1 hypothetical protein ASC85_08640 [Pseudomonas sp. Root401]WHS57491.1 hypothetical protein QLH64_31215 [Pseudomonas brassicacearum]